jgi:hypothetical protein
LRDTLEKKEMEIQGEDQANLQEMTKLLKELATRANSTSGWSEESANDLLKRFGETTERSTENLAKRAEVSQQLLPLDHYVQFVTSKDLDMSHPFESVNSSSYDSKISSLLSWRNYSFFCKHDGGVDQS